jgi:hypothetical protein
MIRPEGIIGFLCTSGYAFLMLYIRSLQYGSGSMQDRASGSSPEASVISSKKLHPSLSAPRA